MFWNVGAKAISTQKEPKRDEQRTMPLLNLVAARARRLQRSDSYSEGNTSQLSSLPPTEDSFVYPEGDNFEEDDNESYDPYLKPLMKERRVRLRNRLKNLSFRTTPVKEPVTPDTTAYETISESPTSMKIMKEPKGRSGTFEPPSFSEIPSRLSHPRNEESIVIHVENDEERKVMPGKKERDYWNKMANKQLNRNGIVHLRTAESLLYLGDAHMCCEEYKEALTVFKGATRIFRKIYGGSDLSVATALNKVGLAACQVSKMEANLRKALEALNQSLSIRFQVLGPSHVDTIDTLNNMAGVYFHLGNMHEARQAYFEVWTMRQAVFGTHHPCVAVTAHALGGVHLRLGQAEEASKYYYSAFDVYRHLNLSEEHPTVARLLGDIDQLGRIMSTMDDR